MTGFEGRCRSLIPSVAPTGVVMDRHETRVDAVDSESVARRQFRLDRIERAAVARMR